MTKARYMALADLQAVWNDSIKPWINSHKADKTELPTYATEALCEQAAGEIVFTLSE